MFRSSDRVETRKARDMSFCPHAKMHRELIEAQIVPHVTQAAIDAFVTNQPGEEYAAVMRWVRKEFPALEASASALFLETFHAMKDGRITDLLEAARSVLIEEGHDGKIARWSLNLDNERGREADAIDVWFDDGTERWHGVAYVEHWKGDKYYYFDH